MRLSFVTRQVVASTWANGEMGRLELRLLGWGRMTKSPDYDGPGLDYFLPPDLAQERLMRETPLRTSVHFRSQERWAEDIRDLAGSFEERGKNIVTANADDSARNLSQYGCALIWYGEHEVKRRFRREVEAQLTVYLRLFPDQASVLDNWSRTAASATSCLPRLLVSGFYFAEDGGASAGGPTWKSFLDTSAAAIAERYELDFLVRAAGTHGSTHRE